MNHRHQLAALAATAVLLIAGCSGGGTDELQSTDPGPEGTALSTPAPEDGQASVLTVDDAWVKAADEGMSAAFGILRNTGSEDVVISAATSDASPIMELHETVESESGEMIMRERDGGFIVPAGGEYLLQPGANHLMLMDLEEPVRAGDEVTFSLVLEDGSNLDFTAIAKDYSGANERYVESE